MPLLNYTTTVPASRTIGQVQEILVKAGARQVLTEYGPSGTPTGIAFQIETPHGQRHYHLPADVAAIAQVMKADRDVARRFKTQEQAERVGWRIIKDWLEAQLAIIATQMVTFDQVMLPYMSAGGSGETVYDLYLSQQLALPSGGEFHRPPLEGDMVMDDSEVVDAEVV